MAECTNPDSDLKRSEKLSPERQFVRGFLIFQERGDVNRKADQEHAHWLHGPWVRL